MSLISNEALIGAAGSGSGVSAYQIEQSLRFDGSARLTKDSGFSNSSQTWTWSCWAKLCTTGDQVFLSAFNAYDSTSGGRYDFATYIGSNFAYIITSTGAGNGDVDQVASPGKYRDTSAWYHFLATSDGTDRILYINGEEVKRVARTANNLYLNQARPHHIGGYDRVVTSNYYLAEAHFIDGTSYNPDNFGEYDANGVWRPIEVSGLTYGTNGFYLKFDPSATNGIGHDHSGNGNNWTPSGFTTSGTGTDVMDDTPTTNWCTLNLLETGLTLSNGNLDYTYTSANKSVRGTVGVSSGKFRWEVKANGNSNSFDKYAGIIKANNSADNYDKNANEVRYNADAWGVANMYGTSTQVRPVHNNSFGTSFGWTWTAGDVLGLYFDATNGTLKANQNGGTLTTVYTGLDTDTTWLPVFSDGSVSSSTDVVNFGQRAFEYSAAESGYLPLNTANLPAPAIKDGSKYFNTVIYQGASPSDKAVTGVGFQPDFTWIKARTQAYSHALYDAVRGATKELHSDTTDQEDTDTNGLKSFDSDGFTVGSDGEVGDPTGTRVAWNWKANGSGSSNTDGTITSTVSANPTAGFSIISFTGTGNAGSIGHGLGVKPGFVIGKDRDRVGIDWKIYFPILGNYVEFTTTAQSSVSNAFTGATSSVLNLQGSGYGLNYSGDKSIVYCFAEVEGYSKFGSYTGNGSLDGPFVYCGFKPAWLIIKRTDGTGEWFIVDTPRNPYNAADDDLFANANTVETASSGKDLLSNGFKIRENGASMNASGGNFVFAAFAENPFGGGSRISPATAR